MKPRKVEKRSITYRKRNHPRDRLSRRRIDLVSVAPQWPRIASLLTKAMTESRYQEAEAKCENGFDWQIASNAGLSMQMKHVHWLSSCAAVVRIIAVTHPLARNVLEPSSF